MNDNPSNHDPTKNADDAPAPPGLDKTIQESIGRKLRSAYNQIADKPAYLGDPALPPEMEDQITRLGTKIRANEEGIAAVAEALGTDVLGEKPSEKAQPESDTPADASEAGSQKGRAPQT